jgi:hypothetical protein
MGHVSSRIRRDQVPGTRSRKGPERPPLFLVPRSAGGSARGSPCPRASRSIPPYRPARVSVTEGRLGERRTVRVGIGRPMAGSPKLFAISGLQPSRRSDHRVRFRTVAGRGKRGGDSSFMLTQPIPSMSNAWLRSGTGRTSICSRSNPRLFARRICCAAGRIGTLGRMMMAHDFEREEDAVVCFSNCCGRDRPADTG